MLLTREQLEEIRKIIRDASTALSVVTSRGYVSDDEIQRLVNEGYLDPNDATDAILTAFELGRIEEGAPNPKQISLDELKASVRSPREMTPREAIAYESAASRAGELCVGLGTRAEGDFVSGAIRVDEDMASGFIEGIKDATAEAVAKREGVGRLTTKVRQMSEDWARDWGRIASTELQFAHQAGTLEGAVARHGNDVLMAKVPEPSACDDCKRLYLGADGKPEAHPASWWTNQGVSNVGRKRAEWKPVSGAAHPWCQCSFVRVPAGMRFSDEWDLEPEGEE